MLRVRNPQTLNWTHSFPHAAGCLIQQNDLWGISIRRVTSELDVSAEVASGVRACFHLQQKWKLSEKSETSHRQEEASAHGTPKSQHSLSKLTGFVVFQKKAARLASMLVPSLFIEKAGARGGENLISDLSWSVWIHYKHSRLCAARLSDPFNASLHHR